MANRSLLLPGHRLHEVVVSLLLPPNLSSQGLQEDDCWPDDICRCVWDRLYAYVSLQLHADIIHLDKLGWRTHGHMHQLPYLCLGSCWYQHRSRCCSPDCADTRAAGSHTQQEEEAPDYLDV